MKSNAVWIDSSAAAKYLFHQEHPFHPIRLALTEQLLRRAGALHERHQAKPLSPDIAQQWVQSLHTPEYVSAVRRLSEPMPPADAVKHAAEFGLQQGGDTPYFPHMHEATLAVVAGSLAAADAVMTGKAERALHLAGGLHHAFPDRAAGFCVYNDAAAAISFIRKHYGARVMYVDTDVHHGDGVQCFYYADADVFTLSIHESGRYLFPGTGFADERGEGDGYGACLNLPLEPYTEDDSWLECFQQALEKAAAAFQPDVIVSQHGCDAHAFDPLSHMHCSMRIYRVMPRLIREAADRYASGRWVALGGGGYDHWRVVPRAWSLLWLEMSGHPLLDAIDRSQAPVALPEGWMGERAAQSPPRMPLAWLDDTSQWEPNPRRAVISAANRKTLELALQHIG